LDPEFRIKTLANISYYSGVSHGTVLLMLLVNCLLFPVKDDELLAGASEEVRQVLALLQAAGISSHQPIQILDRYGIQHSGLLIPICTIMISRTQIRIHFKVKIRVPVAADDK
jgi:hypothetical protein